MPATMLNGARTYVISDQEAEGAIGDLLARVDRLLPHKHFPENHRLIQYLLDEATSIAAQIDQQPQAKTERTVSRAPSAGSAPFEIKAYAQASVRDAEKAFGLSNLSVAWDASGKLWGFTERDHPTVIHLNPGLPESEIDKTIGHEVHHADCVLQGRPWTAEEEATADEAGEWFAKWRARQ